VPLMTALSHTASRAEAFGLILAALTVLSCYTAISGLVKAELFPANVRALGVGLPYAVSVSLFGGTAEYVALAFKSAGHEAGFFWYVAATLGVSLVVALVLPDTKRTSLI
jgi:MHS family alpha-ketoglutarate permease-like MFS transporter